jgi:hypothetical protein
MVDDSLIKPIDGQNVISIKSAKDKDLNDKRKRQNNGQSLHHAEPQIPDDANDSDIEERNNNRGNNILDFRA